MIYSNERGPISIRILNIKNISASKNARLIYFIKTVNINLPKIRSMKSSANNTTQAIYNYFQI